MRALSYAQALGCETAHTATCRCRCHGAMHGAKRIVDGRWVESDPLPQAPPREAFEQLPADDPHHVRSAAEKKQMAKARRVRPASSQTALW